MVPVGAGQRHEGSGGQGARTDAGLGQLPGVPFTCESDMRFVSIDPAAKTGVATWRDGELERVGTLRPLSKQAERDAYPTAVLLYEVGDIIVGFPSWSVAWGMLLAGAQAVVIEESFGREPKTVSQLGFRRGYIACAADARGAEFVEVNTSKWKAFAANDFGEKFPGHSRGDKAHAIALVDKHYGRKLKSDEADAVLIGHYFKSGRP